MNKTGFNTCFNHRLFYLIPHKYFESAFVFAGRYRKSKNIQDAGAVRMQTTSFAADFAIGIALLLNIRIAHAFS